MACEHDEDGCECFEDLSKVNSDDLVEKLRERVLFKVDYRSIEDAYEALLRGRIDEAAKLLKRALLPNGGADMIAFRVKRDQQFGAPGAHGQVGQGGAEATSASGSEPTIKAA